MEFYSTIFDDFLKTKNIDNQKIVWKANSIIKLMRCVDNVDHSEFCTNGLRLIMDLFNHYTIYDHELENDETSFLSEHERELFISTLENELM